MRGVVSMQDEYAGPVEAYESLDMSYLRIPVVDHEEPTLSELKEAIIFLNDHEVHQLGKVYVHCKGGHGRAAAVAFCWLMYKHNLEPEAAQKRLLECRNVRKHLYKQKNVLRFYNQLKKGGSHRMEKGILQGTNSSNKCTLDIYYRASTLFTTFFYMLFSIQTYKWCQKQYVFTEKLTNHAHFDARCTISDHPSTLNFLSFSFRTKMQPSFSPRRTSSSENASKASGRSHKDFLSPPKFPKSA